jgi:hypothetical protein
MRATLDTPHETPEAMVPGMGLLMVHEGLRERGQPSTAPAGKRRIRRLFGSRAFAWVLALLLAGGAAAAAAVGISDARTDVVRADAELASVRADAAATAEAVTAAADRNEALHARIAELQDRIAELEAAKVRTIVETETVTVTETVTRWVPNGKDVTVELTGYEDLVAIHDVQLTHSYGYSDLIGIAINRSGAVISYAQLGCSFLDEEGRLLASGIDNKQDWQPGQSWGFVCSADVNATGGILRVDEMS